MEEKKTTPQYSLIAGILFGVFAVQEFAWYVQYFRLYPLTFFVSHYFRIALYIAVFTVLTVLFIMKKRGGLTAAVLGVLAVAELWRFFTGFKNYYNYYRFSMFIMLLCLLAALAYVGLFCVAAANYTTWLDKYKQTINLFWFLPAALMFARVALGILAQILSAINIIDHSYFYFRMESGPDYIYEWSTFFDLLMVAAMFFAGLAIAFPDGMPKYSANAPISNQNESGNQTMTATNQSATTNEAYCGLVKHILLLLFTFGIWHLIWIYRMTGYTNAVQDEEPRNPANKLLLSLFVPFYIIYWTYKTAQRVDKMAVVKGLTSDMATLCLILEIFVPIIPPILLQDKMNNIITAGDARPAAAPKAQKTNNDATLGTAEELKTYKELLDSGVITQEEFDAKKKQLLGL